MKRASHKGTKNTKGHKECMCSLWVLVIFVSLCEVVSLTYFPARFFSASIAAGSVGRTKVPLPVTSMT